MRNGTGTKLAGSNSSVLTPYGQKVFFCAFRRPAFASSSFGRQPTTLAESSRSRQPFPTRAGQSPTHSSLFPRPLFFDFTFTSQLCSPHASCSSSSSWAESRLPLCPGLCCLLSSLLAGPGYSLLSPHSTRLHTRTAILLLPDTFKTHLAGPITPSCSRILFLTAADAHFSLKLTGCTRFHRANLASTPLKTRL